MRRRALKQHVQFVAESQVLRALAHIEGQLGLAPARVAAVERNDTVFQAKATEGFLERLFIERFEVKPKLVRRQTGFCLAVIAVRSGAFPG